MIYGVYVIRDIKSGYLAPTIDINDATAIRNFEHAVLAKETLYYTHAEDYCLVKIGTYDSDVGVVSCNDVDRQVLIEGSVIKRGVSGEVSHSV